MAARLSAAAEPVRLRMLRVLELEELSVGEVAQVVQLPQSTVSRHLKILLEAGWVTRRSEGTATLYRLVMDDLAPAARGIWASVRDGAAGSEAAEDVTRLRAVLDERRADSVSYFGRVAGAWDDVRAELFGSRFTALSLMSLLDPRWVVADVGCGTGNAAELLSPCVREVVAIDQSGPMLEAAKKRMEHAANVTFATGSVQSLPLGDASVDAAVCVLVLHHVDDVVAALAELRRCLRRDLGGGAALIVDMVEHEREEFRRTMGHKRLGFTADAMDDAMRRAGFKTRTYRRLPAEPEARGPGLFVAVGRV
jgi:ArsR family transcriptional regulator